MKKIIPFVFVAGALLLGAAWAVSLTGPNEYAARIAEAQADLETARALRDQAEALQVLGAGLGRVSLVQSLTLFLLVGLLVGLLGWAVYARLQSGQPAKRPAPLTQVQPSGLPEGVQGLDPALVNQYIQLEMLRALRSLNTPHLPEPREANGKPFER